MKKKLSPKLKIQHTTDNHRKTVLNHKTYWLMNKCNAYNEIKVASIEKYFVLIGPSKKCSITDFSSFNKFWCFLTKLKQIYVSNKVSENKVL